MSKSDLQPSTQAIEAWLVTHLAEVLAVETSEIDVREPWASYGLSSREAVTLSGDLEEWLGRRLASTLLWEYPTIERLARHLSGETEQQPQVATQDLAAAEPIAIVGLGCRFPGASNPAAFWELLRDGIDAISEVPADRWDKDAFYDPDIGAPGKVNTRWGGFLDQVDCFDSAFFGISPREASRMDPQQRLLLEVAWEALEDAGQPPDSIAGSPTGVFIGISSNDYAQFQLADPALIDAYAGIGNAHSIAANRLSYLLDLRGPSLAVDTACSSSLVAVHLACQSLRQGECNLALAGGVNLILTPAVTINFTKAGVMSADGHSRAFDAQANGYVRGEGAGVVVLKPLSQALADGDPIYAVIRGSAVNQDGRSNGLMAPNRAAQEMVLRLAYQQAGVSPGQVNYVEAHGTGTLLGDPIEAMALGSVLAEGRPPGDLCPIGSVKTNFGHLEAAAGVAGLIKVALCLKHRQIPPSLHYTQSNPHIPFDQLPLRVPQRLAAWPATSGPALAGASSFGFGGTNAHVVLQEAPPQPQADLPGVEPAGQAQVLPLSARSPAALRDLAQAYGDFLAADTPAIAASLSAIAYTAGVRRSHHDYRLAVVGRSRDELSAQLAAFLQGESRPGIAAGRAIPGRRPKLAFVFPGQGSQWLGMGRELLAQEPLFRQVLEHCDRAMRPYVDFSLLDQLAASEGESRLDEIDVIQPMLFALQVGLAALWRAWGVEPEAVVGHSLGEVAAAHVSGALSLADAVRIICRRSRLMKQTSGQGAMIAVGLSHTEAEQLLNGYSGRVSVAVSNSPTSTVLAGDPAALKELADSLTGQNIFCRFVKVDVAAHSPQMEPLQADLAAALTDLQPQAGSIAQVSTVTGEIVPGQALDAAYWARNLRQPVLFATAMQRLLQDGYNAFLEISPHPILLSAIQQGWQHNGGAGLVLPSLRQEEPERRQLLSALGALYAQGYPVAWNRLYPAGGRVIQLPSYPWQRQRHWFESEGNGADSWRAWSRQNQPARPEGADDPEVHLDEWFYELNWRPEERPAEATAATTKAGKWLIFSDSQGVGPALAARLEAQGAECVLVSAGGALAQIDERRYCLDPQSAADMLRLLSLSLAPNGPSCQGIVHLWSLDAPPPAKMTAGSLSTAQRLGCASVLSLLQALERVEWRERPRLWLVTQGCQPVHGPAPANPSPLSLAQAPLWGLGRTIAQEHPDLWGGLIDLEHGAAIPEVVALLWPEMWRPTGEDQLAFRQGRRYVARLTRRSRSDQPGQRPLPWRTDGAYLLTGGLGGLGLQVARWLVAQGARRLILLGRAALPPRLQWQAVESSSRLGQQIAAIQEIEAMGASVHLAAVDVADEAQLAAFLATYRQEGWPPIRGVVHMAGVVEPELLRQLEVDSLKAVLRPKVVGSWLLHCLLQDAPLDFFVLFSSAAALLNSPLLGSYAAANAFLDALAHYRRAEGRPALSINWGYWSEAGMAARYQQEMGRELTPKGMAAFTPAQGLAALGQLLRQNATQVGVMPVDWQAWSRFHPAAGHSPLLSDLVARDAWPATNGEYTATANGHFPAVSLPQAEPGEDGVTRLAAYLRRFIAQVLYIEEARLPADGNLMDLGMDSLMAMELIRGVERDLHLRLYPREILERPSIGALAQYLATEMDRARPEAKDSAATSAAAAAEVATTPPAVTLSALGQASKGAHLPRPAQRNPAILFLLSAPRSGSTLLRVMLAGHPALFCPPELHLLPFDTMGQRREELGLTYLGEGLQRAFMELQGLDADGSKALLDALVAQDAPVPHVYAQLQALAGRRLLVDKSPSYAASKETLARAEALFNGAKYIHLVRHPYAMIESSVRIRLDRLLGANGVDPHAFAEQIWTTTNRNVLDFAKGIDPSRYFLLRYEELVSQPAQVARQLCEFLAIPFTQALVEPYTGNRMTDGIHATSLGIGDPNFLAHKQIDPHLGQVWREIRLPHRLNESSQRLAADLHYELPQEKQSSQALASAAPAPPGKAFSRNGHSPGTSPLVLIQPRGEKRPLFFVHPASGIVYPYYELARALGEDRPFYGIQDPSLEGGREPFHRLEDYAEEYIRAIRSVQPEGPYFLGGWSFGGTVAVEMARRLHERGQPVALLVAVDSESPLGNRRLPLKRRLIYYKNKSIEYITLAPGFIPYLLDALYLLAVTATGRDERPSARLSPLEYLRWAWTEAFRRGLERRAGIADVIAREERLLQVRLPTRSVRRGLVIFRYQMALINSFRPEVYPGKLVLLRAAEQVVRKFHFDPQLGWGDIVTGGVEVHAVPGNHMVLFQEPYIQTLAATLKTCIERAEAEIKEYAH